MNSGPHTESDRRRLRPPPTSHGSARGSRRRHAPTRRLRVHMGFARDFRHRITSAASPSSDAHHRNLIRRPCRPGPFEGRHGMSRQHSTIRLDPPRLALWSASWLSRGARQGRQTRSVRPSSRMGPGRGSSGRGCVSGRTGGDGRASPRRWRGDRPARRSAPRRGPVQVPARRTVPRSIPCSRRLRGRGTPLEVRTVSVDEGQAPPGPHPGTPGAPRDGGRPRRRAARSGARL
jgi:hypothetical protein